MAVNIKKLNQPLVYNYGYDQLNRLLTMDAYKGWNGTGIFAPEKINDYHEKISYDGNGNILSYVRNGSTADGKPLAMDNLQYAYNKDDNGKISNNRLRHVKDAVGNANYTEDIDNQSDDNYTYDAIGNLIKDNAEKIENIEWNVYGKIQSISKIAPIKGDVQSINYSYDASGNRISKVVKKKGIGASDHTWYTRDASGNVMAVYTYSGTNFSNGELQLTEHHLYGSSRLGIWNRNINVNALNIRGKGLSFERGKKFFELPNQLGNVLVTVSDKKRGVDSNGDGIIDFYEAEVVAAQDYYPFGMLMPGRKYSVANTDYRYGFNGKELDKETSSTSTYDYGFRIYSPGLGRFLSVDPITRSYPMLTPYQFASNRPIDGIDLDGLEYVTFHHYTNGRIGIKMHYKSTNKDIEKIGGTTKGRYNSVSYGPLGKGVVHYFYNANDKLDPAKTLWEQKQGDFESDATFHGHYSGPGSVTKEGLSNSTKYDFSLQPIDWADAIAKRHDMDYAESTNTGGEYAGFLEDIRTVQADRDMVTRVDQLLGGASNPLVKRNKVDGVETLLVQAYKKFFGARVSGG